MRTYWITYATTAGERGTCCLASPFFLSVETCRCFAQALRGVVIDRRSMCVEMVR